MESFYLFINKPGIMLYSNYIYMKENNLVDTYLLDLFVKKYCNLIDYYNYIRWCQINNLNNNFAVQSYICYLLNAVIFSHYLQFKKEYNNHPLIKLARNSYNITFSEYILLLKNQTITGIFEIIIIYEIFKKILNDSKTKVECNMYITYNNVTLVYSNLALRIVKNIEILNQNN